jgi:hypothetical protein
LCHFFLWFGLKFDVLPATTFLSKPIVGCQFTRAFNPSGHWRGAAWSKEMSYTMRPVFGTTLALAEESLHVIFDRQLKPLRGESFGIRLFNYPVRQRGSAVHY